MATANCYEKDGTAAGQVDLPEALFAGEINDDAVHQAVVTYQANQRQGNAETKERSDVRGGGRKPYRQKGTGRARAGTIRSPIWRGGGVVFGPHQRSYNQKMSKKMRRVALRSSLTSRANDGDIVIIKDLNFGAPKTKDFATMLKGLDAVGSKVVLVLDKADANIVKSARNIPRVKVTLAEMLSIYDVVWADKLLFANDAVKKMEEVFSA
jgi:large subunit ribosomal protein L4